MILKIKDSDHLVDLQLNQKLLLNQLQRKLKYLLKKQELISEVQRQMAQLKESTSGQLHHLLQRLFLVHIQEWIQLEMVQPLLLLNLIQKMHQSWD